jgi:hypothetical protein
MSEIKIKLYTGNKDRINISSGCKIVSDEFIELFENNSFMPILDWKRLEKKDFKQLFSFRKYYTDVSLIKLPKTLKNLIKDLNFKDCFNIDDIRIIENTKEFVDFKNKLINYFSKFSQNFNKIIPHNVYFGNSNLICNTFNFSSKKYIGLHLDSWEGDNLKDRIHSNNRVCINLGKEPRYLMFYNISIIGMAIKLNISIDSSKFDINDIYYKFAKKFPETPIYRLEIAPYEAYIAPTEFIIHDGSTLGTKSPDINIVLRGKFKYKYGIRSALGF